MCHACSHSLPFSPTGQDSIQGNRWLAILHNNSAAKRARRGVRQGSGHVPLPPLPAHKPTAAASPRPVPRPRTAPPALLPSCPAPPTHSVDGSAKHDGGRLERAAALDRAPPPRAPPGAAAPLSGAASVPAQPPPSATPQPRGRAGGPPTATPDGGGGLTSRVSGASRASLMFSSCAPNCKRPCRHHRHRYRHHRYFRCRRRQRRRCHDRVSPHSCHTHHHW